MARRIQHEFRLPWGSGRSFARDVKEGDIEVAILVDHLRPTRNNPVSHKRGLETWALDWSADGHYLAWSEGSKIIQLVPWNKYKHCRLEQDNTDFHGQKIHVHSMQFNAGHLVWSLALGPKDASICPLVPINSGSRKEFKLDTTHLVLAAGAMMEIKVWSVFTGQLMYLITHHTQLVRDLRFAPDGSQQLMAASRDGTLSVWDLANDAQLVRTFRGVSHWIFCCAWSPKCDLVCAVGDKKMILIWETETGDSYQLDGHQACVTSCEFSPDGALLATSSFDTTVIIWDPYSRVKLKTLYHFYSGSDPVSTEHRGWYVRHLTFSWDSRYLASVCEDSFIRFWDLNTPDLPKQVALVSNPLCCVFSPDGIVLAVGNRNGVVTIWLSIIEVPTLQHLCRMSIRRVLHSNHLDRLNLPNKIRRYLKYFEDSTKTSEKDSEELDYLSHIPNIPLDVSSQLEEVSLNDDETSRFANRLPADVSREGNMSHQNTRSLFETVQNNPSGDDDEVLSDVSNLTEPLQHSDQYLT